MINFFTTLESIFGSYSFVFGVTTISFLLKASLLIFLIIHGLKPSTPQRAWTLLILVLIGGLFNDSSWMLALSKSLFFPEMDIRLRLFWIRIAWGFAIVMYQALALLIEHLADQQSTLNTRQKIFLSTSSCFIVFFLALAVTHATSFDDPAYVSRVQELASLYMLFPLMISSLYCTIKKLRSNSTPRILRKQLTIVINWCIIPTMVSDFIQFYPFGFFPTYIVSSYAVVSLSCIFLTYGIYYSARKMIGLRFLNMQSHVKSSSWYNFIDDFTNLLEQLGHVTNPHELSHITQNFFKETFDIPFNKTRLSIRTGNDRALTAPGYQVPQSQTDTIVENFLTLHEDSQAVCSYIQTSKILIYDEIAFTNFYQETPTQKRLLNFLDLINADVFIPVYEKQQIIAYIVVERHARQDELYSDIERDEMVVFASYLSNIINLLQHRNLEILLVQEKEMKDELYFRHQEINQYKESIQAYLRANKEKKIGIIFYKNKHFTFGNAVAKELSIIDINKHEGHPFVRTLTTLAREVEEYKTPRTHLTKTSNNLPLVINAIPNLERNNVIITLCRPEISDIIKQQVDLLKDPTKWDYLLYLETTAAGAMINQLIPSNSETFLNFKIELLKIALNKQAALLEMPDDDLLPAITIVHHISKREILHTLELTGPTQSIEHAAMLFGINQVFDIETPLPLFKKLDNAGTLFIKNVHFLDLETQEQLASYMAYGYYRAFKSEQKIAAHVRVLCSTNQNLQGLVSEGKFSNALFNELKKNTLTAPSIITLPEQELYDLAQSFFEQTLQTPDLKNLLELTDREKQKIATNRPSSLHELKGRIRQGLIQKSKRNSLDDENILDPVRDTVDPELIQAARLGKQALKDPKILGMLWNKFKNQNQIATFLGVNRSSVNRRCKDYNLL